jgi:lipopolysaccharide transport system ATP-binding protein
MSEPIIRARDLTKLYPLYERPHHRLLDMFGLLPQRLKSRSHTALSGVNFDIHRGEKVAIIGRNGAGKSTLLKMIGGVVQPTSGSIAVEGEVHALLNLGTGFHPDFTGRENVLSYLAHLGIDGETARKHLREIVDFAEVEEYIDQPLKTYSSGMGMRLMFAAATVIQPDVLIVDEVLSVGDAYFMKKSHERIKELCTARGTTLLMVTHDLYTAMSFCDSAIWLDGGRIMRSGAVKQVADGYEAAVRDQEERRLRTRRLSVLEQNRATSLLPGVIIGELRMADGNLPSTDIAISHFRFFAGEQLLGVLPASETAPDADLSVMSDASLGCWGELEEWFGRMARRFLNYGSIFHKLPFSIAQADIIAAARAGTLQVEIGCRAAAPVELTLAFDATDGNALGKASFTTDADGWRDYRLAPASGSVATTTGSADDIVRYGQRAVEITGVEFCDAAGNESHQFTAGGAMQVHLHYRINQPDFDEMPTIIVAFLKNGVLRTHRFYTDQIRLAARGGTTGTLTVSAQPLLISMGTYMVTVSIFAEGFFQSAGPKPYFTSNPLMYDMHSRAYEVVVLESPGNSLMNDVVFLHPSEWSLQAATPASDES